MPLIAIVQEYEDQLYQGALSALKGNVSELKYLGTIKPHWSTLEHSLYSFKKEGMQEGCYFVDGYFTYTDGKVTFDRFEVSPFN